MVTATVDLPHVIADFGTQQPTHETNPQIWWPKPWKKTYSSLFTIPVEAVDPTTVPMVKRWQKPWWTTHPSSPFAGWIDKKNLPIIINHPPLSQVEPKCLSKCLLLGPCLSSCPAKLREAIPCHSANVKAINTENQMINPVFGRCALYQRYKPLWRVCVCVSVYISFR